MVRRLKATRRFDTKSLQTRDNYGKVIGQLAKYACSQMEIARRGNQDGKLAEDPRKDRFPFTNIVVAKVIDAWQKSSQAFEGYTRPMSVFHSHGREKCRGVIMSAQVRACASRTRQNRNRPRSIVGA